MFGLFRKKPPREPYEDAELGTLRPGDGDFWESTLRCEGRAIILSIAGGDRAELEALAQARALTAGWSAFAERVARFLEAEGQRAYWRPPEAGIDHRPTIAGLAIREVMIFGGGRAMVLFEAEGPYAWRCNVDGGVLSELAFDS